MQSFISEEHRDLLKKKENKLLGLYFASLALGIAALLCLILLHTLETSSLYLGFSIAIGVLLALWSVFFWDYLFRRNHGYLRLEILALYAKTSIQKGTLVSFKESLYQGYLPLEELQVSVPGAKGAVVCRFYSLKKYSWEAGKEYAFQNYGDFITGLE